MTPSQADRNIRAFIAFRVLFNARFYYPVLSILFLDLGLTLEQYGLLNVAWAVAIVCLEVPSGALADQIGRKRMVVAASALMVVEMLLFAFAPAGGGGWLFAALLCNRILSGAAEASASGADEALAFGSLKAAGREAEWPSALARLMRWQSAAFFCAMLLGSAVYDARLWLAAWGGLGWDAGWINQEATARFPVYLTLGNALLALVCALRMQEPPGRAGGEGGASVAGTIRQTLGAGGWILRTPAALMLVLAALCYDSVVRLFLTFQSNYFRLIGIPEVAFGLIGSALALLGFVAGPLGKRMVGRFGMGTNFAALAALVFTGLLGVAAATPLLGVWVILPLGFGWSWLSYFLSHYLNAIVPEAQRATVLSFRGLAINLGYGGIGLLYAGLTRQLHAAHPSASAERVFALSLPWLPAFFVAGLIGLGLTAALLRTKKRA